MASVGVVPAAKLRPPFDQAVSASPGPEVGPSGAAAYPRGRLSTLRLPASVVQEVVLEVGPSNGDPGILDARGGRERVALADHSRLKSLLASRTKMPARARRTQRRHARPPPDRGSRSLRPTTQRGAHGPERLVAPVSPAASRAGHVEIDGGFDVGHGASRRCR